MNNTRYLLLVEDNPSVQNNNKKILERHGYIIKQALTLAEAREIIAKEAPRAIVLDIMLPDGSGLDFLQELRETSTIPVLLLTALGTPKDLVAGLAAGGDDYLPKPYDLKVFLAKIEALLRRSAIVPETLRLGRITLSPASMTAYCDGKDLLLTQKEFAVLLLLAQNEGKVLGTETIYGKIWEQPLGTDTGLVKNLVSRLRKKLAASGYTVSAQYGEGYCLEKE
ncbi:MAG: response regulator transcription factor [Lachnospiraceae bacterium]|jgi:DNA-binding response OmpR family regulator|nr:response regulator transcription factor [Lachnospiraceae bacterium]